MRLRIFRAFWLEHRTRTWPFLLTGLVVAAAIGRSMIYIWSDDPEHIVDGALFWMLGIAFAVQSIGLLYNGESAVSLSCGLPDSTLRLPVSSGAIVFSRFAFNLIAISSTTILLYLPLTFLPITPSTPLWDYVALLAALISVLQLVALATSGTGDWAIGFIAAAAVGYLAMHDRLIFQRQFDSIAAFDSAVVALAFPATWATLGLLRQGRGQVSFALSKPFNRAQITRRREPRPFASPRHAQIWFDTHRYWVPFSRIFIVLAALSLFLRGSTGFRVPLPGIRVDHSHAFHLSMHNFVWSLIPCILLASFFTGMIVALQNKRLQTGPMAVFLYLRPISTTQLADARITAAMRLLVFPLLALTIGYALFDYLTYDPSLYHRYAPSQPTLADIASLYALSILPPIVIIWFGFWIWNLVAVVLVYIAFGFFLLNTGVIGNPDIEERYFTVFLSTLFVLGTAFYVYALSRRLLSIRTGIGLPLGVLILMVSGLAALAHTDGYDHLETALRDHLYLRLLTEFMMSIAPAATIPLALRWSRHR